MGWLSAAAMHNGVDVEKEKGSGGLAFRGRPDSGVDAETEEEERWAG